MPKCMVCCEHGNECHMIPVVAYLLEIDDIFYLIEFMILIVRDILNLARLLLKLVNRKFLIGSK